MFREATLLTILQLQLSFAQIARTEPTPASIAQTKFQIEPGLKIELVAAEPLVQSPAAMAWDEESRLFVAENTGYPVGPPVGEPPLGKIIELRDTDRDGKADLRVEFANGFNFPNGLMPWRGGWLVTDAPHLYWLVDTNRDGREDLREVWFTGFATNQSTQLRACYPVLASDGWIYVARGWSGGKVSSPKWTNLPVVDLKNGDFRFRPDGSKAEAIGGNAQFGMVVDDVGRRFLTSNRNPIMHAVARPDWWTRMPGFYFTEVVQDVSPVGSEAKVFPISADLTTSGFMPELMSAPHAGTFTSACGLHQFFGEGMPERFQGSWFICEPAQNLVQRQVMVPEGASFRTRRATEGADFLASSDTWFHPVYSATGPDGALYIADMYRNFIDHPEYLPKEARGKIAFEAGRERGRIWRVSDARTDTKSSRQFSATSSGELAAAMMSENIWKRQTAHRLILERKDSKAVLELMQQFDSVLKIVRNEAVEENVRSAMAARLAQDPPTGPHLARARTVQLLADLVVHEREGMNEEILNRGGEALLHATFDPSPSVREAAFRAFQLVSDRRNPLPDVGGEVLRDWVNDPSPTVRFHLAYSLGQGDYQRMTEGLVAILRRDAADRWTQAVVFSGLKERMREFAEKWFATEWAELPGKPPKPVGFEDTEASVALAYEMGRIYGKEIARESVLLRNALGAEADGKAWQAALLTGLLEAGNDQLHQQTNKEGRLARIAELNLANALNHEVPLLARIAAVRLLGELGTNLRDSLTKLVTHEHPKELQIAAARALVKAGDFPVALFGEWRMFRPEVREIFIDSLVSKPDRATVLLDAIERGDVPLWNINANRKNALQRSNDAKVKARTKKLLGAGGSGDARKRFEEYKSVLALTGNAAKGKNVFLNLCSTCHQHKNEGHKVGPDLTGVRNQPAEALLYHILVPDAEIYAGYLSYDVETKDGEHVSGLLAAEDNSAVTLVRALGEKQTIDRDQIARIRASSSSLMPSELETAMSRQELADLITFLKAD